jgi:hypothetical protein
MVPWSIELDAVRELESLNALEKPLFVKSKLTACPFAKVETTILELISTAFASSVTVRTTPEFELAVALALIFSKLVKSVLKVFIFELKLPNEDIDRFVFSTFLVILDWATNVSALTSPVTKPFKSIPEPEFLFTLDMISLPVVVVPDVELPVLAT